MTENNSEKYAYLDQLSTRRLEELLLADAEDPSGQDTSEAVLHILEVLRQREDGFSAEPVDVDRAWEEFQQYYNTPEGEGRSLYSYEEEEQAVPPAKKRFPALWKTARIAAATVAVLFALMVGAQASGLNVFGALAQWTSETFHFGGKIHSDQYEMFIDSLKAYGISEDLVPTWFPQGFTASEPTFENSDDFISASIYFDNGDESNFWVCIKRYTSQNDIEETMFEKDTTPVEVYTSHGKTFYIMSNTGPITATWINGMFVETIRGNLSTDDFKRIIDSIGGS